MSQDLGLFRTTMNERMTDLICTNKSSTFSFESRWVTMEFIAFVHSVSSKTTMGADGLVFLAYCDCNLLSIRE